MKGGKVVLELQNVHTYYGESHILQGVSLKVPPGSLVALLGRNGMGKSTAIHTIMGLQVPRSGSIFFKGLQIAGLPAYRIAGMGMAIVPQGRRIFHSLTVKENLMLGLREKHQGEERAFDLERIYDLFPILKIRAGQQSQHLSGGEQEMLCISRALISNPDLVLMDEPFEGLAPVIVGDLVHKLKELNNIGLSILLVEQNVPVALQIADYVYVMEKGRITLEGTPANPELQTQIQRTILGF
jgi:branched-chain amino acid transport system ATP-binding protein